MAEIAWRTCAGCIGWGGRGLRGEREGFLAGGLVYGIAAAEETDEDALDYELLGGDEVGEMDVFGSEEGGSLLDAVALEGGLAVDEGGDDVSVPGLADFEDGGVAVEDVGIDHGVAMDADGEAANAGAHAEGGGIDGKAAFGGLVYGFGHAGGDAAIEGDVDDGLAGEDGGEGEGAGLAGDAVDGAFFLEGFEVIDGGGLACETEVFLDFAGAGHDAAAV